MITTTVTVGDQRMDVHSIWTRDPFTIVKNGPPCEKNVNVLSEVKVVAWYMRHNKKYAKTLSNLTNINQHVPFYYIL